MWSLSGYLGLFLSSFIAATFLPLQSELVLVSLLLTERFSVAGLFAVATLGNVLGSLVNWVLGLYLLRWQHSRWFPVSAEQLARAQQGYRKYGFWSLLLSWMPVIGDPLTLAAGVMREPLWRFLVMVSLAKAGRYLVLILLTLNWAESGGWRI
ncbi:MAG: YqaA family protein [Pseudomonas sp.]